LVALINLERSGINPDSVQAKSDTLSRIIPASPLNYFAGAKRQKCESGRITPLKNLCYNLVKCFEKKHFLINRPTCPAKPEWLGRQDSNLRMPVPKTSALPLGYAPTFCGRPLTRDIAALQRRFARSETIHRFAVA
jgi:hypothetical protein